VIEAKAWADMFALGIPIAEKIIRPILVYAFLVVGLRLAGKRELAQVTPFDLIVLMTLSNAVQNAIIGDDNSVSGGIIGATTLLVVNYLVVRFLYDHQKISKIVEGDADMLIKDGRILHDRLQAELITVPELEVAAHRQGIASLDDVEKAILESGGTISFIPKTPTPEMTRHIELLEKLAQMEKELAGLNTRLIERPAG